jgi:hypothetical protein
MSYQRPSGWDCHVFEAAERDSEFPEEHQFWIVH